MPRMHRRSTMRADVRLAANLERAYLHHVVKAGEIIASMLLTWHNLTYFQDLMSDLREAIAERRVGSLQVQLAAVDGHEET